MKNLRSNINIYSSKFILFLEQKLNVTGGDLIVLQRLLSLVLVFFLIFSGSVLATHESKTYAEDKEKERLYIVKIMNEVFEQFQSYSDWSVKSLHNERVTRACKEILEKKYGISYDDYYVIILAVATNTKECPVRLIAVVCINGEYEKPWCGRKVIDCVGEKPPQQNKIQVKI